MCCEQQWRISYVHVIHKWSVIDSWTAWDIYLIHESYSNSHRGCLVYVLCYYCRFRRVFFLYNNDFICNYSVTKAIYLIIIGNEIFCLKLCCLLCYPVRYKSFSLKKRSEKNTWNCHFMRYSFLLLVFHSSWIIQ